MGECRRNYKRRTDGDEMTPYYDDGKGIVIYNCDCRDILPQLEKVDLVLTDPPYGISYSSQHIGVSTMAEWMDSEICGDSDVTLRDHVLSRYSEWACFGSYKATIPNNIKGLLIWDKGPASGMGDLSFPWKVSFEYIFIAGKCWSGSRDEGVIKGHTIVTRLSMGRTHPNEKPVSLLSYLISKHSGNIILDPFMGSGTTLVAAQSLGRKAIGIEIESKYCDIAIRRLQQQSINFTQPVNGYKITVQEALYGTPTNGRNEEKDFAGQYGKEDDDGSAAQTK